MCSKRNKLNKQIIECRSQLSNVWPSDLLRSFYTKIQALNSKLFHHLDQTEKKKENLTYLLTQLTHDTSEKQKAPSKNYKNSKP